MAITTVNATVSTSGATTETLWTSPTAFTGGFIIHIAGYEDGGTEGIWTIHAGRSNSDNSIVSVDVHTAAGDFTGWTVELVESGDALNIDVTGVSGNDIEWHAAISYFEHENS